MATGRSLEETRPLINYYFLEKHNLDRSRLTDAVATVIAGIFFPLWGP